jgi:uncharacterized protein with NRDE domain
LPSSPSARAAIAANRDEFHERAALPAHWWDDGILAGRDAVGGGTWFGITPTGRWALITNFREGTPRDPAAPSRGALVTMALRSRETPLVCAARIAAEGARYHGFNLLVGDTAASCAYASNRASGACALGPGVFGLSNHLLETPWPKVVQAKARLAAALATGADPVAGDALVAALLADRSQASTGSRDRPACLRDGAPAHPRSSRAPPQRVARRCLRSTDGGAQFVGEASMPQLTTGEVAFAFRIAPEAPVRAWPPRRFVAREALHGAVRDARIVDSDHRGRGVRRSAAHGSAR